MFYQRKHKHIDTRQRFTIKKFKIGAASVLIGTVFAGFGTQVKASETVTPDVLASTVVSEVSSQEDSPQADAEEPAPSSATITPELAYVVNLDNVSNDQANSEMLETSKEVAPSVEKTEAPVEVEKESTDSLKDSENQVVSKEVTEKPVTKAYTATNTIPVVIPTDRPDNEGQPIATGTGFRGEKHDLANHPGYSITDQDFPEKWAKYKDTNPDRLQAALFEIKGGGLDNYLTISADKQGNAYVTEFESTGDVIVETTKLTNDQVSLGKWTASVDGTLEAHLTPEGTISITSLDKSVSLKRLFDEGIEDGKGNYIAQVGVSIPKYSAQVTKHVILDNGTDLVAPISQDGFTGDSFTTVPVDTDKYDVLAPLNPSGIVVINGHKGPGYTFTSKTTYPNGEGGTVLVELTTTVQEDGGFHVTAKYDGIPQKVYVPAGRSIEISGKSYTVYKEADTSYSVTYTPDSPNGPYRAHFTTYFNPVGSKKVDDYYRKSRDIAANETLHVADVPITTRPTSSPVTYYYTQETAEIKFWDESTGARVSLANGAEDITGLKGKGGSAISAALDSSRAEHNVDAIIKKYTDAGYKVKVNEYPGSTFNNTTAKYPLYNPDPAVYKTNELARQEQNKKVINIVVYKDTQTASVIFKEVPSRDQLKNESDITSSAQAIEAAKTQTASGDANTPITFPSLEEAKAKLVALGYDIVSDSFTEGGTKNFDDNKSVNQEFKVVVTPRVTTKQETKEITRTITYATQDENGENNTPKPELTHNSTVTYTRTVTENLVTKVKAESEWTTDNPTLSGQDLPDIPGYLPSSATRNSQDLNDPADTAQGIATTNTSDDVVEHVIYRPVPKPDQYADLKFYKVDVDGVSGKELFPNASYEAKGKENTPITFSEYAAKLAELKNLGYEVVTDEYKNGATFDNDTKVKQSFEVILKPTLRDLENETRVITREITYEKQNESGTKVEDATLEAARFTSDATYTRTVKQNAVTGAKIYGEWTSTDKVLEGKDLPNVEGYRPISSTRNTVAQAPTKTTEAITTTVPVDGQSQDVVEHVIYRPVPKPDQQADLKFFVVNEDGSNKRVAPGTDTYEATGKENTPITFADYATKLAELKEKGYVVDSDNYNGNATFDTNPDDNQHFEVVLKERIDNLQDETKVITRTITYEKQNESGTKVEDATLEAARFTSDATYTRTVKQNAVTGAKIYGEWTSTDKVLEGKDLPNVEGYRPISSTRNTVAQTPGKTTEAITTTDPVDGQSQDVVEHVVYQPISDLSKTATRTIYYKYLTQNGEDAFAPVTQTVTFTRSAVTNPTTGEVEYTAWKGSAEGFTQRASAPKADYLVDRALVEKVILDPNTVVDGYHVNEYVIYTPVPTQNARVIFKEVPSRERLTEEQDIVSSAEAIEAAQTQIASGKAKKAISFPDLETAKAKLEALGYEIVSDSFTEGTAKKFDNDANVDQEFKVIVTPRYQEVPPSDNPDWPEGTPDENKQELVERVTRTIHYRYLTAEGEKAAEDKVDTLVFERTALVNLVTKEVSIIKDWTPKTTDEFANVTSPVIDGYTADKLEAGAFTGVKATDADKEVTVVYTPIPVDKQLAKVIFKEVPSRDRLTEEQDIVSSAEATKAAETQTVTGDPNTAITFPDLETAKAKLEALGYEVLSDSFKESADKNFDNDSNAEQVFKVIVTPRYQEVPPSDNPDWPEGTPDENKQELVERVTRTIHYRYLTAEGEKAAEDKVDTLVFERTALVNLVTKEVSIIKDWVPKTTDEFANVTSPVIDGYTADKLEAGAFTGVKATDADKEVTVVYTPIPINDEVATLVFKEVPSKHYKDDESKQTDIPNYPALSTNGQPGTPITFAELEAKKAALKLAGYEILTDTYAEAEEAAKNFDNDPNAPQTFKVIVTPKITPITPEEPGKPGEPIDPDNPDGPKWPKKDGVDDVKREITRTVRYNKIDRDFNTSEAAPTQTTTVTYTRHGEINHVTGVVTWAPEGWTAKDNDSILEGRPLPEIDGYYVKETRLTQGEVSNKLVDNDTSVKDVNTTPDTVNILEIVTYVPLPDAPPPVVPEVKKGTVIITYEDTEGNVLKTPVVDDSNVPVGTDYNTADEDGDKPTEITHGGNKYVLVPSLTKGEEKGKVTEGTTTVTYVYQKVGNWIPLIPGEPKPPKTPYPFNPEKPKDPIPAVPEVPGKPGVPVVPHVPGYEPFEPTDPTKPLQPVDPKDPNKGYIPPVPTTPGEDTLIPYKPTPEPKKGTVIITYEDTEGNALKTPVVDDSNVPVGTDYNTADEDGDKPTEITRDGQRYVLVPSLTKGEEKGKVTEGTTTVTYVYQKVGNWIPLIPGEPKPPKTPYPFNPEKPKDPIPAVPEVPGKPGVPVVPNVPGYEPFEPTDPTKPLQPVDPKDPNKGYIPPVPTTPGEDTLIPYKPTPEPKKGTVIITYEDTEGNALKTPVVDDSNVPVGTDYNTADEDGDKPTEITRDGQRYVLVPSLTKGEEKGKVTEGTTIVTYVYQKVGNWIPLIPGEPNPPKTPFPFNPEKPGDPIPAIPEVPGKPGVPVIPYVPDYEPEIPLVPVDPNDPNKGYIPPAPTTPGEDILIPYVPVKKGTIVIEYRDVNDKVIKDPVVDEDNVKVGTSYDTTDEGDKPTEIVTSDGSRYVLVPSLTKGEEKGKITEGKTTITYVYQKVGNWIPLIPGEPNPPKTPFPFNPEKPGDPIPAIPEVPGKPGVPVIPYVPDYEPEIPLVPVDPNDPNKGYIPPAPTTPGEDILIPYVPVKKGTIVIEYRDVNDKVIKDPVVDEDNVKVGTSYDTTDEGDKPTEIVTADGSRYVLVPSLTKGEEKGKVTEGKTTITYVYQKVGNWIPLIPGEPNPPKTPYPFNPEKPGDPIPVIPEVPGKPGVPVIPYVPDYEPEIPLVPVDPNDPNKGYIPPAPTTPGEDILIPYKPVPPTTPTIPGVEIPEVPDKPTPPTTPEKPGQPMPPVEPSKPTPPAEPGKPAEPTTMTELPKTGDAGSVAASAFGIGTLLASLGLVAPRRKKD